VLDSREYMIGSTLNGGNGLVLASRPAVDQVRAEVGVIDRDDAVELSPEYLDGLVDKAKALLGDFYDGVRASYERGRRSHTPPQNPHRLMQLLDAAETAASDFRAGSPAIDPIAITELHGMLGHVGRWQNHPLWSSLLSSLASPEDFPHLVLTFAAAGLLHDFGNGVELVRVTGERTPDLRIHLKARTIVGTEIKTPLALQRPQAPLGADTARVTVRKALKKAGSGIRGQLKEGHDAVLLIGGFSLRDADLDALEAAAANVLAEHPERRAHLLGITLVSLGVLVRSPDASRGRHLPTISEIASTRVVDNPNYSGDATLSRDPRTTPPEIEEPLEEVDLASWATFESASNRTTYRRHPHAKLGRNDMCWCGSGLKYKRCHGRRS
jgi:hypothetical protein